MGTDGEHKSTEELLCQEYVLRADHVIYRIRPKDGKHPVLLPIGETAEFRIDKDKLILRVPEANDKEHEYSVISVAPRSDVPDPRSQKLLLPSRRNNNKLNQVCFKNRAAV